MRENAQKILFVFGHQTDRDENTAFLKQLAEFREIIQTINAQSGPRPEYFLLWVGLNLPAQTLQCQDILDCLQEERRRGEQILKNAGRILAIPPRRQHYSEGNVDVQALRLKKRLKLDRVIGHTPVFNKFYGIWKILGQVYKNYKHSVSHFRTRSCALNQQRI